MIVVVIVGLLAGLAVQTFNAIRTKSQATVLANDFRKYADAFETYALEFGNWPEDTGIGVVPPEMTDSLTKFDEPSTIKGSWDWDYESFSYTAGVAHVQSGVDLEVMREVDAKLDDGSLSSGRFQQIAADRFAFILEN